MMHIQFFSQVITDFTADPTQEWRTDLSDQHRTISNKLDGMLREFKRGEEGFGPRAVVGPYGAGKTQFLYEVYRRAWKQGIPAVYTDLRTIVRQYNEAESGANIRKWVEQRVKEEAEKIQNNNDPDWDPHFRTTELEEQFYENYIEGAGESGVNKYVLLIDEVEQKYTDLLDRTDDKNPVRDLLDELQDILAFWSFGLVSAYEVTGEADRRRFKEIRIPVLDTKSLYDNLSKSQTPTEFTNGVWWLARGRHGWASKHSEMLEGSEKSDKNAFNDWVNKAKDHSYYGADAISPIWHDVDTRDIYDAKRTALFVEPAYLEWSIRSTNVISVEDTLKELSDHVRQNDMDRGTEEIIRNNLKTVLQAMSTPAHWVEDDDDVVKYLPANFLGQEGQVEGLFNLLSDFIMSFEKRGETRRKAAQAIEEINYSRVCSKWGDLIGPKKQASEVGIDVAPGENFDAWTVEPEIVRKAYPPLALEPEKLTDDSTHSLYEEIESPIPFQHSRSLQGTQTDVRLCPTETAYNSALDTLKNHSDVSKTVALVIPDTNKSDSWKKPSFVDELENHNLATVKLAGGKRIWDLVVQLNHYTDIKGYDERFSTELVKEEIIPNEEREQIRNTVDALFSDLNRFVEDIVADLHDRYRTSYQLDDNLIWNDPDLHETSPFYGYTGSADKMTEGVSFGVVFSERNLARTVDCTQFVEGVETAYDNEYINQGTFGKIYILRRMFSSDEFGKGTKEARQKYTQQDGSLRRPVQNLQNAVTSLSELNNQDTAELYKIFFQKEDQNAEEIEVVSDIRYGGNRAGALITGLLLDWTISKRCEKFIDDIEQERYNLEKIKNSIDRLDKTVTHLNENLEPPEMVEVDDPVSISLYGLNQYRENVEQVEEGFKTIVDEAKRHESVASAVAIILKIAESYRNLINDQIKDLREVVRDASFQDQSRDLGNEFAELYSWVTTSESLSEIEGVDRDEVISTVEALGKAIFDFSSRLGNLTEIRLDDRDSLTDLKARISEDLRQIEGLNKKAKNIDRSRNEADKQLEQVKESLSSFSNSTQTEGYE